MAKKTTSSTDASKAITPKKAVKKPAVQKKVEPTFEKPVAVRKKRTVKATLSKPSVSASLNPKPSSTEPVIAHEEISLRAYYIGERRQQLGWPGDSANDWLDAVAQLKAEALEKPLKKR
jgi:hypothetical protein